MVILDFCVLKWKGNKLWWHLRCGQTPLGNPQKALWQISWVSRKLDFLLTRLSSTSLWWRILLSMMLLLQKQRETNVLVLDHSCLSTSFWPMWFLWLLLQGGTMMLSWLRRIFFLSVLCKGRWRSNGSTLLLISCWRPRGLALSSFFM